METEIYMELLKLTIEEYLNDNYQKYAFKIDDKNIGHVYSKSSSDTIAEIDFCHNKITYGQECIGWHLHFMITTCYTEHTLLRLIAESIWLHEKGEEAGIV